MPNRTPPTVRLRRLSARLRKLRETSGMSREDVAERTGINPATLYRVEKARGRPQARTLNTLLVLYGVDDDERATLLRVLKDAGQRGWLQAYQSELPEEYSTYIEFEDEARAIWHYESLFVPGLLQTEAYARAVISRGMPTIGRDQIEHRVNVRMERQAVLTRDHPVQLWAICDEAALHRVVGGAQIMREQLLRLSEAAELPYVTFQVIPFEVGAHPGMPGSFVVMDFADDPNIVHIDSMAGDLFLEEEPEVRRYTVLFEHLRAVALSPAKSVELIARRT